MKKILAGAIAILVVASGGYFLFLRDKDSKEHKGNITISAAASLYEPLNKVKEDYEKSHKGINLDINFASSSTLAKQIEQGAPVDIFISASPKYTNELVDKNIVNKDNISNLLGNKLVLAMSKDAKKITSIEEIKDNDDKIALGDKAVPVGLYAEEAFSNMGILNYISNRIVYCKDAISVLNYLEKGEVDYGVIYENELIGAKNLVKVAEFPSDSHKPIVYTMATLNNKTETIDFKKFLESNEGKEVFKEYGFEVY